MAILFRAITTTRVSHLQRLRYQGSSRVEIEPEKQQSHAEKSLLHVTEDLTWHFLKPHLHVEVCRRGCDQNLLTGHCRPLSRLHAERSAVEKEGTTEDSDSVGFWC